MTMLKTTLKPTLKLTALVMMSVVLLTGCQSVKGVLGKRDNGSLDYVHATKLDPIRLPANQASAPFISLYDVPEVAGEITPSTNESGRQYQLPRPPQVR